MNRRFVLQGAAASTVALAARRPSFAAGKYGPGVSDSEIKLGQTVPYSGPASAYSGWGLAQRAYFDALNAAGGINGRKITLLSLDDGGAPPKTVEATRKLVESDEVLAIVGSLGAAGVTAVHRYLDAKGVPQLFLGIGTNIWGPAPAFRWGTIWSPDHRTETRTYAEHALRTNPQARIAILTQDDDTGRNQLNGLRETLGARANAIVAASTYQLADTTVDSQIITLQSSGANVFINMASPKFAAQAIRRAATLNWKPAQYLFSFSSSVKGTLEPAGLDNSAGIYSATYIKDPGNPTMKDDAGVRAYLAWMAKYYPAGDPNSVLNIQGYSVAQVMEAVLRACGNDLTRENLTAKAKSIQGLQLPMFLPGVPFETTPDDVSGIHALRLQRFDGQAWSVVPA